MKEFLIVRHARSRYNIRLTADLDSELTPAGVRQAEETAGFLAQFFPDLKHYQGRVSPLRRTLQTARIIHEATGLDFRVDPALHETMVRYQSFSIRDHRGDFPEFAWPAASPWRFVLPGEDVPGYMARMADYLAGFGEGRFVLVTHGTPTQTLGEMATGIYAEPVEYDLIKNCGMTWVVNGGMKWWNKVAYDEARCEDVLDRVKSMSDEEFRRAMVKAGISKFTVEDARMLSPSFGASNADHDPVGVGAGGAAR